VLATNSAGKFFDSLAAGTPVIVTQRGWTTDVANTHRCEWEVPSEDLETLARTNTRLLDTLRDLAGRILPRPVDEGPSSLARPTCGDTP